MKRGAKSLNRRFLGTLSIPKRGCRQLGMTKAREAAIIQQQNPEQENQIVQERIICGEYDRNLPQRNNETEHDSPDPWQKYHPHQT